MIDADKLFFRKQILKTEVNMLLWVIIRKIFYEHFSFRINYFDNNKVLINNDNMLEKSFSDELSQSDSS